MKRYLAPLLITGILISGAICRSEFWKATHAPGRGFLSAIAAEMIMSRLDVRPLGRIPPAR